MLARQHVSYEIRMWLHRPAYTYILLHAAEPRYDAGLYSCPPIIARLQQLALLALCYGLKTNHVGKSSFVCKRSKFMCRANSCTAGSTLNTVCPPRVPRRKSWPASMPPLRTLGHLFKSGPSVKRIEDRANNFGSTYR